MGKRVLSEMCRQRGRGKARMAFSSSLLLHFPPPPPPPPPPSSSLQPITNFIIMAVAAGMRRICSCERQKKREMKKSGNRRWKNKCYFCGPLKKMKPLPRRSIWGGGGADLRRLATGKRRRRAGEGELINLAMPHPLPMGLSDSSLESAEKHAHFQIFFFFWTPCKRRERERDRVWKLGRNLKEATAAAPLR